MMSSGAAVRAQADVLGVIEAHGVAVQNDPDWKDARAFQLPNDEFDALVERVHPWMMHRNSIPFFTFDGYTVRRTDPWTTAFDALWTQKTLDKT